VRIGRRPLFFLVVALACLALVPPTPAEFRWVNLTAAGTALFWAVLLAVEEVVARRQGALPPGVVEPPSNIFRDEREERERKRQDAPEGGPGLEAEPGREPERTPPARPRGEGRGQHGTPFDPPP
jgi:hypothetical protein